MTAERAETLRALIDELVQHESKAALALNKAFCEAAKGHGPLSVWGAATALALTAIRRLEDGAGAIPQGERLASNMKAQFIAMLMTRDKDGGPL